MLKSCGYESKGDVLDDPYLEKNMNTWNPQLVCFADKLELRHIDEILAGKARTMTPDSLYNILWHKVFFRDQSQKLKNIKEIYYGWSPWNQNVHKYARKIQRNLDCGWTYADFDVSGWDRSYPLGEEVWEIRESGITVPEELRDRFNFQKAYDIAPLILLAAGSGPGFDAWRLPFQSSGKDETTGDNSIAHVLVKYFHVYFHLLKEGKDKDEIRCLMKRHAHFIIYSDDNVNGFGPHLKHLNTLEKWSETYEQFGWLIRDYQFRDKSVVGLKFLGFTVQYHWRQIGFYAPCFDAQRIRDSLYYGRKEVTVEKYWGLLLLAYSTGQEIFNHVWSRIDLIREIDPTYALNALITTDDKVHRFCDGIVFGFESLSSIHDTVDGGFMKDGEWKNYAQTVSQAAEDFIFGTQ